MSEQKNEYGLVVAQEGIDVRDAADYNMVLDSRWKFLETEAEIDKTVTVPSSTSRMNIYEHGLPFIPAIHGTVVGLSGVFNEPVTYADKTHVFIQRPSGGDLATGSTRVRARVYNLNITEDYLAPSLVGGSTLTPSNVGLQALDGTEPDLKLGEKSITGYSVDTKKKVLSIHKHGVKLINEHVFTGGSPAPDPDIVVHNVGYKPSYFIAKGQQLDGELLALEALQTRMYTPAIFATDRQIRFSGVQSVYAGWTAFIILKDPLELAV